MNISVLTIVHGRQTQLHNQLLGLLQSEIKPAQWIIVGMNQDVELDASEQLPIRTGRVDSDAGVLPLARARNCAASLCDTECMVFLDVDCIPSPSMLGHFSNALSHSSSLWMGAPRYLPAGAAEEGWQMETLKRLAIPHPLQPIVADGQWIRSERYELFWSLCFAIHRADYQHIGGFDEDYCGYGGEDTDFAFLARAKQVSYGIVGATAFHQHHRVCKPPLNHFASILSNAKRFRKKWGTWPMQSWLNAFAELGLIEFDPATDHLAIIKVPTQEQIQSSWVSTPAGF